MSQPNANPAPLHEQLDRLLVAIAEAAASNRGACLNSLQDHAREVVARVKQLEEGAQSQPKSE